MTHHLCTCPFNPTEMGAHAIGCPANPENVHERRMANREPQDVEGFQEPQLRPLAPTDGTRPCVIGGVAECTLVVSYANAERVLGEHASLLKYGFAHGKFPRGVWLIPHPDNGRLYTRTQVRDFGLLVRDRADELAPDVGLSLETIERMIDDPTAR